MLKETPPSSVLSAGLAIALLLFLFAIHVASSQPGLGFSVRSGLDGVVIQSVDEPSKLLRKVEPGDLVLAVRSSEGLLTLESWDAVAEPDDAVEYATYNRFFQRHAAVWQIIQGEGLEILVQPHVLKGPPPPTRWVAVTPSPLRGIGALPLSFWYQMACALAVLLMGVAAWAFVNSERGPQLYALAGLAVAVAITASAIYTSRELTLAPEWFLLLSRVNQAGAMLFAGLGTTLFWYYPVRLGRFTFEYLTLPLVVLTLIGNWLQLWPNLDFAARYPLLVWLTVDFAFAFLQWQRTRFEPVERARLKWMLVAWFTGAVGYLGAVIAPQVIGFLPLIPQQYAWGLFVISYLGIALGIVRYRLFDLDRWILMAWFWFAFGVVFAAIDACLVLLLDLQTSIGVLMSLALVGWVYLPLRNSMMNWLSPSDAPASLHKRLPAILQQAFEYQRPVAEQWGQALQDIYHPLSCEPSSERIETPQLRDNGLRMAVPAVASQGSYLLSYASGGRRLFNPRDLQFGVQALTLFRYARDYHQSFQNGVMSERQRVARDLHDDVGARLLSVVYRAQGDEQLQRLARECLGELREVIQGLQKTEVPLLQSYARWHAEARERCTLFGVALTMDLAPDLGSHLLSPRLERNLSRVLRECLSNSFRHAEATSIMVSLRLVAGRLALDYADNGRGLAVAALNELDGLGLEGIRQRCEELGGEAALWSPLAGGLAVHCEVPMGGGGRT